MTRIGNGLYTAELQFPLKGIWDLTAIVSKDQDQLSTMRRINVMAP
jgi:hypothetical protein